MKIRKVAVVGANGTVGANIAGMFAALKKDAWICADWCSLNGPEYAREAANRILELTKGAL